MHTIDLAGKWTLSGAALERPLPARIPGCVHTDLLASRVIRDPYYRDNETAMQWIGEADWTYAREFTVPAEVLEQPCVLLECDGLDTLASISINGRELARTDNMFRAWKFDAKQHLRPGRNTIEIRFTSPLPMMRERTKQRPLPTWWFPGGGYIRKEYCNFGWDWGPTLVTCGIWRGIRIVAHDGTALKDVHVLQHHAKGRVDLGVRVAASAAKGTRLKAQVEVSLAGNVAARGEITLSKKRDGVALLALKSPKLWWPAGMGEQPLYNVSVTLTNEKGECLDGWERRVGLRVLELKQEKDKWGQSFTFVANGIPFFAKGANWIPADTFATRVTREDYARLLDDAAAANMNMVRVWAGGFYEDDAFYDLCDERGLCVWQDFMFACATYPTYDKGFMKNVEAEARDNIRRLRHHACLALWCGNNELEQGLVDDEWTDTAMSWKDYGRLFDTLLPSLVSELDPQRPYWPGSPHTPVGDRRAFNDQASGDAHLWDVWHGRKPFEWYYGCRHRFVSEFGFQSFPHPRTVEGYTIEEDRNITSYVMELHQRAGRTGNSLIMLYMLDYFRLPKNFESTLWLSQILQGVAVRMLVEQLRRNQPQSMGALYWQLNDCWPVASWASIDGHGRWKALHYMAKRFFAPALISPVMDEAKGTVEVHVTADSTEKGAALARWIVTNLAGKTLLEEAQPLRLPAGGSRRLKTLQLAKLLKEHGQREVIVFLELEREGAVVSTNFGTFARPKHMNFAATASAARTTVRQAKDGAFEVSIRTKKPLLFAWLTHESVDIRCSENFVPLRPGRTTTIRVEPQAPMTLAAFKNGLRLGSLVDTYD
ncbi:MAG: beta-mannosidase [Candidatus Sumerlaeota bacterium]|nr:beta-mannosidase [Candidatus Sumerlaeota bacterium]